jgi:hypothetical protein
MFCIHLLETMQAAHRLEGLRDLPDPGGTTTGSQAKGTGQEQSHIEGKTTTDNIRSNTPERGTDAETNEQSACGETHPRSGESELVRDGSQCQSNTLQMINFNEHGPFRIVFLT